MEKDQIKDYQFGLGFATDINSLYGVTGRELKVVDTAGGNAYPENAIVPLNDFSGVSSYVRSMFG